MGTPNSRSRLPKHDVTSYINNPQRHDVAHNLSILRRSAEFSYFIQQFTFAFTFQFRSDFHCKTGLLIFYMRQERTV